MRFNFRAMDVRSLLFGLAIGAGGLLLLGADGGFGPGQSFPRFQVSRPWVNNDRHGIYVIDTSNGQLVAVEGDKAHRVEGP
jgi:hypothetical protein